MQRLIGLFSTPTQMSVELESKSNSQSRSRRIRRRDEVTAVYNWANEPMTGRIPRPPDNQVYRICASAAIQGFFTSSTTVEVDTGKGFSINDLTGSSATTVQSFDQYRIDWLECWLAPRVTNTTTTTANFGVLASVVDYDNATSTSLAALEAYGNVFLASGIVGRYHAFKPHAAAPLVLAAGGTANVLNVVSPWVDSVNLGVAHYGLKTAISTTDFAYPFDIFVRFHISLRNSI
jgi:hypothetical protein